MTDDDGRHDFDFLFGRWTGQSSMLTNFTDPDWDTWAEFDQSSQCAPVLGGLGNVEQVRFATAPPGEGMALRLFEPASGLWRIWWAGTSAPGELGPPVTGRFVDGIGTFEGEENLNGRAIPMRYVWSDITATSARWTQSYRLVAGGALVPNWTMRLARAD